MPIQEGGRFTPTRVIQSPGVFTRELDSSATPQGVADIGGVIVAPFSKGPGFSPITVNSVSELESKFGTADGTYYGPYTAKEYLKAQGQVTVCRVGALTGYHQKKPLIIYAEPGTWTRNTSSATLVSASSYLLVNSSNITASLIYASSSLATTLTLTGSFLGKFQSLSSDSSAPYSVTSTSGSLLYAGQQFVFNIPTGLVLTASQFRITSSYQGDGTKTEYQKLAQAIAETTETSCFLSSSAYTGSFPITTTDSSFAYTANTTLYLLSASIRAIRSAGTCGTLINISGVVTGSFGKINGSFVSTFTDSNDPCNPATNTRNRTVLAVLNNTQNAATQFNSNYEVQGFDSSTLTGVVSTRGAYSGSVDPTNNKYTLTLGYSYTDANSTAQVGTYGYYDFSLNSGDNNYITNVFGNDPTAGASTVSRQKVEAAYIYKIFPDTIAKIVEDKTATLGWDIRVAALPSSSFSAGNALNFTDTYSTNLNNGDSAFGLTNASTPWIYSQQIAPWKGSSTDTAVPTKYKLFKAHTLADGTNTNTEFKIEISNVKLAGTVAGSDWGSFTLSVREFSDSDRRPKYLEIFQNLNLDPESPNFVARRIGDRYNYITYEGKVIEFGTYSNVSKNIRIEMIDVPYPMTVVPYGFESYKSPLGSTISTYLPPVKYSKASIYGLGVGKYASGTVFNEVPSPDDEISSLYPTSSASTGVYNDTYQYFAPLPAYGSTDQNGRNIDFDLEAAVVGVSGTSEFYANGTGSVLAASLSGSIPSTYDAVNESTYVKMRKFLVGFQGGFDGQWPAIPINVGGDIIAGNTQGLDCSGINSPGSIAYKQAMGPISNPDELDVNLIAAPGIFHEQHSYVTQLIIDTCEARGDVFYIMDNIVFPDSNQTVGLIDSAIDCVSTIDSNYVATYYPWVKILDTNTNKIISVPPSVVLPAVYAANDSSAAEWFAPAGLNRGGISQATQLRDRLTHSDRDDLYNGRVNPIVSVAGEGIVVWGQKTLQHEATALDRINVRRLLINLKKYVNGVSKYLVFEQNVSTTRNRFLGIVNPYLESVQQRSGLYAFQIKNPEESNTPDLIDRNILYFQLYLQPAKSGEYVLIDMNISPTGATFGNI